jgi:hypothetical protein
MRARVRRAGVTVLDHHPATELLSLRDGAVAGASGLRLQEGGTWTCRAAAVILATGGTAFLSRLLGANNNTADGHLMAAEAGAELAGMEFSCYYTVAAAHSTMTRSFPFVYGTYRDGDGNVLAVDTPRAALPVIARALTRGPVTVARPDARADPGPAAPRAAQLPAPAAAPGYRRHRPGRAGLPGRRARPVRGG